MALRPTAIARIIKQEAGIIMAWCKESKLESRRAKMDGVCFREVYSDKNNQSPGVSEQTPFVATNSTDSKGDTCKASVGSGQWLLQTWKRQILQRLRRYRKPCRVGWGSFLANMWSSFVAGLCVISLSACGEVDKWERNCEDNGISAFVYAQFFVKDHLISPSSADFPTIVDSATHVFEVSRDPPDICTWSVSSYVDSQNTFGAMLRAYYSVKLTYRSSTDSWILKELDWSKGR